MEPTTSAAPRPEAPRARARLRGVLALALALHGACVGLIGEPGLTAPGPGAPGPTTPARCDATPSVEPAVVRKLNRREYANTLRDLLGAPVPAPLLDALPADSVFGFDNQAASLVASPAEVEQHLAIAEALAASADLARLVPCAPDAGDAACVEQFVRAFGRRAFRRPVEDAERATLARVYADARTARRSFEQAARLVLQAVLQSPQLLYRVETSATARGGVQTVGPFELASRLSYFLWASMPDEALLAAAEAGRLGTPRELEAQARRMLEDPRARAMVDTFHTQWLELYRLDAVRKDAELFPTYDALRPAMLRETTELVRHVFWEGEGRADQLLRADFTFASPALAAHYGVEAPAGGAEWGRVSLASTARRGVLGHGSVLSLFANPDRTSPTLRGRFVREQLLCQPPPPPPPGIPPLPSTPSTAATLRERLREHTSNPSCAGCHHLLDPVGFGLENFDAAGAYRTHEAGALVDSSGELRAVTGEAAGAFRGGEELARRLAAAPEYGDCVATQWFRFALGRREGTQDLCAVESLRAEFRRSGGQMRELLVAIARSPAFASIHTERLP